MSLVTTATRMWLTRSFKPFVFHADDGRTPPDYAATPRPGLYVHIPFCRSICDFCPYCKVVFRQDLFDAYIDALEREIELVTAGFGSPPEVTSLYFGGGSPALAADRFGEITGLLRKHYRITDGIGVELEIKPMEWDAFTSAAVPGVNARRRASAASETVGNHCAAPPAASARYFACSPMAISPSRP